MVDRARLENERTNVPRVRIPLSPPFSPIYARGGRIVGLVRRFAKPLGKQFPREFESLPPRQSPPTGNYLSGDCFYNDSDDQSVAYHEAHIPMHRPQITLTLAMSLDGYIARSDGSFDWITGDGAHHVDTPQRWDFAAFLADVDIVVMGRNSYAQGFHAEYADKQVVVLTTTPQPAHDHVVFCHPAHVMAHVQEQATHGRAKVYVFGGGRVVAHFIDHDAIDDYYVGIVPVILGEGIALFGHQTRTVHLALHQTYVDDGVVVLHYRRRARHELDERRDENA